MQELVFSGHTGEYPLLVTDEDTLRSLRFGSQEQQSCIDLRTPWVLQLAYTRWMMTALLLHPSPEKFLLIGLGGGAMAHFLVHHHPEARIDAVEKDEQVIRLARGYFKLPVRDGFNVIQQDALSFLQTSDTSRYHIAFVDIFTPGAMAGPLFLADFHRAALNRLSSDGVLAINLWSGDKRLYEMAHQAVRAASGGRQLRLQVRKRSNVILLVFPSEIPKKQIKEAQTNLHRYQQRYQLDFSGSLKRLRRAHRLARLTSLFP
ncbi:fused MFS/spermidine synthase [Desulfobulbus alkaliphilus]|uniref:fused MFS/spermidine synthase n=1 Tax=Desulfobulbus alkaliphilus TaxID=869814 RepID=UPI0019641D7C|nr:fused MFS/spermidine synthase [Desulfobulbus alkaliphilus]MBM9536720.1 fused MFS/spermidine synthase [Desulfobulbus alkaliphilus]